MPSHYYLMILQQHPFDVEVRYQLGMSYQQLGRTEQAHEQFVLWELDRDRLRRLADLNRMAIERPDNVELKTQLADACDALENLEPAAMWPRAALGSTTPQNSVGGTDSLDPRRATGQVFD